jgi:mRNA interferase RelE/StbE
MYKLVFNEEVYKDLKKLDKPISKKIITAIKNKLIQDPISFGKPLTSTLKGFYRMRVKDYRVIYKVENQKLIVFVIAIGSRKMK